MMTSARGLFHSILHTVHFISVIMKSKLSSYVSKCNYFLQTDMHILSRIEFIKSLYFVIALLINVLVDFSLFFLA